MRVSLVISARLRATLAMLAKRCQPEKSLNDYCATVLEEAAEAGAFYNRKHERQSADEPARLLALNEGRPPPKLKRPA